MTTFVWFRETNDHEGESWTFWLRRDGNEEALTALAKQLVEDGEKIEYDYPYQIDLTETLLEDQVDLLCDYAESGYYDSHNKVDGTLTLPENFSIMDGLYKGGIRDLFKS